MHGSLPKLFQIYLGGSVHVDVNTSKSIFSRKRVLKRLECACPPGIEVIGIVGDLNEGFFGALGNYIPCLYIAGFA